MEPWLERILKFLEFVVVAGITIAIIFAVVHEVRWVLWGVTQSPIARQDRLRSAIVLINENWRLGLILFVPLFYRTLREFLSRAEEIAGIKASPRAAAGLKRRHNPSEFKQSSPARTKEH